MTCPAPSSLNITATDRRTAAWQPYAAKLQSSPITLNKVQQLATEANTERELRKLVHLLMVLWEEVIRQDLEPTQEIYLNALHALALAAAAAQDAYADITKVTTAISRVQTAARSVDDVVKFGVALRQEG